MGLDELVREGERAADDDDRRRARALERPGREGGRRAALHRARAGAARGRASCGAATSPAGGSTATRRRDPVADDAAARGIIGGGWIARRARAGDRRGRGRASWSRRVTSTGERAEAIAGPARRRAVRELARRCSSASRSTCCGCARRRCTTATRPSRRSPAGVHVYLEKPIARTLEDAEAIVEAAGSAAGDLRRRLPVARHRAARRRPGGARRPARSGMLVGRNFGPVAGPAVVRRPGAGRWPDPGAGEPPHRPAAGARGRDRRGRGVRAGGAPRPGRRGRRRSTTSIALAFHFAERRAGHGPLGVVARRPARAATRPICSARRRRSPSSSVRPPSGSPGVASGRPIDGRSTAIRWSGRSRASWRRREAATGRCVVCPPERRAARTLAVALACERALADGTRVVAVTVRRIAYRLPGEQRQPAGRVGLDPPERAGALIGVRCRRPLVAVTYSVEPAKMQLVACSPRSISSSTSPSAESTVTPSEIVVQTNSAPVRGERHAVGHVAVAELCEGRPPRRRRAGRRDGAIDSVQYMRAVRVEGDPVGVHLRPLHQHLAVVRRVEREQPARRGHVDARVLLGAGVGEPQPAVGPEGEVVGAGQGVAVDLGGEQLDRPSASTRWMPRNGARSRRCRGRSPPWVT